MQSKYDEVMMCVDDPVYFISKYLYVQHPIKGRIPFELFPFQKDCINDFLSFKHNIIVKSRQLGISETVSAYCLWLALFHRDKNIVLMATTLKTAGLMVRKIREKFKMLPPWMTKILDVIEPESNSKFLLILSNGSSIKAVPATDGAVRGEAGSVIVVDEAAHINDLPEIWKAIWPTLSTGGSSIVFSSPNGKNHFHELYDGAEHSKTGEELEGIPGRAGWHASEVGGNGFHAISLPWQVQPERTDEWFTEQSKGLDIKGIAQELLCSFEISGKGYFGTEDVSWIKEIIENPSSYSGPKGKGSDLWIWKDVVPEHKYVLCADVARGDAADFSAFHIIDTDTHEVVAEYMGKIPPDRYGDFISEIATKYNKAFVIYEKNTFGHSLGIRLRDLAYTNVYYEEKIRTQLEMCEDEDEKKDLLALAGLTMKSSNREEILNKLEQVIRNKQLRIYSSRFISQMEHFIWTGKKAQAIKNKNDDLITALAFGLWIYDPAGSGIIVKSSEMDYHMAFLAAMQKTGNQKTRMETGLNNFGSNMPQNPFAFSNSGRSSPLTPGSTISQPGQNKFLGKRLPAGVDVNKVALDYAIRTEFDWVLK